MTWDAKLFNRHLATRRFGRECVWLAEVDSTNRWLADHDSEFTMSGGAVVADHQTEGRGRRDRNWQDVAGASLLCSVLLRHSTDNRILGWLCLAPAVALAEVLQERFGAEHRISLKWPNDVRMNGRKIAGILGRSSMQGSHTNSVVGVGVNLSIRREQFLPELAHTATSLLAETETVALPEIMLAEMLNCWEPLYDLLLMRRTQEIERRWMRFAPALGTAVTRREADQTVAGTFEGLGDRGQLLLRDDHGTTRELFTGDLE